MALASRGARDDDSGQEAIRDEKLAQALMRQGRRIHASALVTALIVTVVAWLLPL